MDIAMRKNGHNRGVVLLLVVFVVALISAIVIGMLQLNTEDIQIMRNHIHAAEVLAIAEAGLDDALSQLRANPDWRDGFQDKPFAGGAYTVTVDGPGAALGIPARVELPQAAATVAQGAPFGSEADCHIASVARSSSGFIARIQAEVSVGTDGPPYDVAIDRIRVNE